MRESWRREPGFAALFALCLALAVVVLLRAERARDGAAVYAVEEFKPPASALIDINTADAALLKTLPGVGDVLAQRIIEGRPYAQVDDLINVYGIGEKTLARLRDRVCVGSAQGDAPG